MFLGMFSKHFKNFVVSNIVYHDQLVEGSVKNSKARIVIIGRRFIIEETKKYPITNLSELKKIVHESCSTDDLFLFSIGRQDGRHRTVRKWTVSAELVEYYKGAFFWIPDTWLAGIDVDERCLATVNTPGAKYFLAKIDDEPVTNVATSTINLSSFAATHGMSIDDAIEIELTENKLQNNIWRLDFKRIMTAFKIPKSLDIKEHIFNSFVAASAVFLLYLCLSSLYLYLSREYYENAVLVEQNDTVSELVEIQGKINSYLQSVEVKKQILEGKNENSKIWILLSELLNKGVNVEHISFKNDLWYVKGAASSASEILKYVKGLQLVETAEFENAVRRSDEKDRFSIVISLRDVSHGR